MEGKVKKYCDDFDCMTYCFMDSRIPEFYCDEHDPLNNGKHVYSRTNTTKGDLYAAKLVRENLKYTSGGIPITVHKNGYGVKTWSDRRKMGGREYSYYNPMDYPTLFGWDRNSPEFIIRRNNQGGYMPKLSVGDYVYHENSHTNGTVIGDRGGHVGRWTLKMDNGDTRHASSRDCTVIKPAYPKESNAMSQSVEHHLIPVIVEPGEPSLDEKVDLIMEHLGITIERLPSRLVVTSVDENATDEPAEE